MNFYRAILFNPKLKCIIEVEIKVENEYNNILTLLECDEVDLLNHPDGYSVAIDGTGFFKLNNIISLFDEVEQPVAGNILILGPLDEVGYATNLPDKFTIDYFEKKIKYFATITNLEENTK